MGIVVHLVHQAVCLPVHLHCDHECYAEGIVFMCIRRGEERNIVLVAEGGVTYVSMELC